MVLGAFLIPFVLTILFCGIPLYFAEFGIGKFSGKGPYLVWDVAPLFRGAGLAMFLAYTCYMFGSTIFRAWIFKFFLYVFRDPLPWSTCSNSWNTPTCRMSSISHYSNDSELGDYSNITAYNTTNVSMEINTTVSNITNSTDHKSGLTAEEEFWKYNIVQLSSGLTDVYPLQWQFVAITFAFRVVVMFVVSFGIRGIEKLMYISATLPVVISLAMFVRSLMLPGATSGLYHFFYPDVTKLMNVKIWIEAFIMGFYTLGFGWGCILSLGARTKFKDNVTTVATLCPILDAVMAIFQGMVCFSVLGNMAASHGVDVKNVIEAGLSTGIVAYVTALSTLPFPQLWSFLFFLSFILSGLDTQIVPFEMCVHILGEIRPKIVYKYRPHTVAVFSFLLFVLGLPTCTGAGAYIFLLIDWYAGAWSGPIVAFVEVLVLGWIYGLDRWSDDVKLMSGKAMSLFMHIGIGFTTPVFVVMIFFVSVVKYIPPVYGSYTYPAWARLLGWSIVATIMLPLLITAAKCVCNGRGAVFQRIKCSLKPNEEWGPADADIRHPYCKTKQEYRARHFGNLVLYNFTRRRRETSAAQISSQEMAELI